MNKKLLVTAVAATIAPMAAQALDVSVSGHVNRAIRFADNGVDSDVQHVDGSASKSRFRLTAEGEVMAGLTAGAHIEYGSANNPGGSLDVDNDDEKASFDARHSLLYLSGEFGKITLGNAPSAGNGIMWTSHNGAWMGTEYSPDTNTGLGVMTTDGAAYKRCSPLDEPTVTHEVVDGSVNHVVAVEDCAAQSVFSFFPSVNTPRMNTLRYDTPSIGPVTLSASIQKDSEDSHDWHFGASLSHDVGAANVIGGLLYEEDKIGIAGGIAFANGTSVNAAWGSDDASGQDFEDMYINVAHSWGNMSVAVDYRSTDNDMNMEGRAVGLGAQYSLGGGVDVYAGFNNYSFDVPDPDVDLEDISAFHVGSRVRFN